MTESVNDTLRAAVAAFAADPTDTTSMDVVRHCLHGELLLDITGSDVTLVAGEPAEVGALAIRGAEAPDGGPVLLAFTSQHEIERMHPPGTEIRSFGQPATAVVEFAYAQEGGWLYLDAGGTTCAMPRTSLQLAVEVPRNDAVREALIRPEALLGALRASGVLLLAAEPTAMEQQAEGELGAGVRAGRLPDGQLALLVFTSAPELLAHAPDDAVVVRTTGEVLAMVREGDFAGVVVNPAGPSAIVARETLLS